MCVIRKRIQKNIGQLKARKMILCLSQARGEYKPLRSNASGICFTPQIN
jgi:hypothetical protein